MIVWGELPSAVAAALLVSLGTAIGYLIFRLATERIGACSGKWTTKFTTGGLEYTEEIKLRSILFFSGSIVVKGTSICTPNGGKPISYNIIGLVKEKILVAAYLSNERHNSERGVFVIQISPNGKQGEGMIAGYRDGNFVRESNQYNWAHG